MKIYPAVQCPYRYRYILFIIISLLLVACGSKDTAKKTKSYLDIADPKTLNETFVSNPDNILSNETIATLNQTLKDLDISGRAHIDVVVVESVGDAVPKDVVNQLFKKWKIGLKEANNGLLILVVHDQHRIEFETGYGLEGDLPDIICHRIQQQYMVPHARENNLDLAVTDGVAAVIRQLQTGSMDVAAVADSAATVTDSASAQLPADTAAPVEANDFAAVGSYQPENNKAGNWVMPVITIIFFVVFAAIITGSLGKAGGQKGKSQLKWLWYVLSVFAIVAVGVFFPAGWGFLLLYAAFNVFLYLYFKQTDKRLKTRLLNTARYQQYVEHKSVHYGMAWARYVFPLLIIYWRKYTRHMDHLRNDPYLCQTCNAPMNKLTDTDDDLYLEKGNVAEEVARSVDYDVWVCSKDDKHDKLILMYMNLGTKALKCNACNYLTLMPDGKEVVVEATQSSSGWGWKLQRCHFCDHREQEKYTIAQISSSSSSSSGGSSGGGFSSSSGGSSGGGGAGSSW